MSELEKKISQISGLLNKAIREKNSKAYKTALAMLQKCNPKPTLQQILDAQAIDNERFNEEQKMKEPAAAKKPGNMKDVEENKSVDLEELSLKELEAELENIRQQDHEEDINGKTKEELEAEEEQRLKEVIKRYEKTFGRIKDLGNYNSKAGSVAGKSVDSSKQSKKSRATELSTASQREAVEKLRKLEEEEEKIKREKEELMKFLELRSNCSKTTSRPVTVSSIISRTEPIPAPEKPESIIKKAENPPKALVQKKKEDKSPKPSKAEKSKDEVSELFNNLY